MKCPKCGTKESRVKKTIIHIEESGFAFGELKKRDRECLSCGNHFRTFEVHEAVFRSLPKQEASVLIAEALRRRPLKNQSLDLRRSLDD